MQDYRNRSRFFIVTLVTLLSLFLLLSIRVEQSLVTFSLFWIYGITITCFLLFVHITTRTYKCEPDHGYRPSMSVIVPVKNEEAVIESAVNAILNSNYPADKVEVIVVNDGSTDNTGKIVEALAKTNPRVNLLTLDRNYGKRIAFAEGVKSSKSQIIVCIDSDTLVEPDALMYLVQPFVDENVVATCGHGYVANKDKNLLTKLQHYWYQDMFRLMKGMESKFGAVSCCSGILAAYRRDSVTPVLNSWLNEKFLGKPIFIGDDRQLTNLVLWKGLSKMLLKSQGEDRTLTSMAQITRQSRVVYQSNSLAYTFAPDNFKQFLKQQLRWKRAWVHGTMLAGQFMWRKKFPIPIIWYTYQFLTYVSPLIIITWLIIKPIQGDWLGTLGFLAGTFFIALLQGLNLWSFGYGKESIFYRVMFVFVSFFMTLTVLLYAWGTPWKGGWVTRQEGAKK